MKLSLRDIVILCVTVMISFPVVYFLLLFVTGSARIEINHPKVNAVKEHEIKVMRLSEKSDSLAASQSQTFLAVEQEKAEVENEKERLTEQQNQIKIQQDELEKAKTDLDGERLKLEKLVSQSDSLDKRRIKQLAKVYEAMRPEEAARILETLNDNLCINILSSMNDDRQKAKILAALSPAKAAQVSKKLGMPLKPNQ